jgi:hypothetical protein
MTSVIPTRTLRGLTGPVVWALHECERSKRELKHSTHDEKHFGPREPFPLESWAQLDSRRRLARCWRSLVREAFFQSVRRFRRLETPRPRIHRPLAALRRRMLSGDDQSRVGVVTARLGACEHAIETFEGVKFCEGLRHNIVHCKASLFQHSSKSTAHAESIAGPLLVEMIGFSG